MTHGDARLAAFVRSLDALGDPRVRPPLELLFRAYADAFPQRIGDADGRADLRSILEAGVRAKLWTLPVEQGRSWDRSVRPALPDWIARTAAVARSRDDGAAEAWPAELAFAASERRPATLATLRAVRRFLREGGAERPIVPLRERSVELFHDEKRLDALLDTALFGPDKLSLELLRCTEVVPPLAFEAAPRGPTGRPMIVLENLHTWESFRRWNAERGAYAAVVYGQGRQLQASWRRLLDLERTFSPSRIEYFGDLDAAGVAIPYATDAMLRAAGGLGLVPARRHYEELVTFADRAQRVDGPEACEAVALGWLPEMVRGAAEGLFEEGRRLPQEWVGLEVLHAMDAG